MLISEVLLEVKCEKLLVRAAKQAACVHFSIIVKLDHEARAEKQILENSLEANRMMTSGGRLQVERVYLAAASDSRASGSRRVH